MLVTTSVRIFTQSIIFSLLLFTASANAGVFQINTLTDANFVIIDHNAITGDDAGGIAASSSQIFYYGDSGIGRFNIADLTGGTNIGLSYRMISDLATSQVYALGSDATTVIPANSTGTVTHLLEVDGATGALTGASIALSTSIVLSGNSGYFAGHERIVIHDTTNALNIELPSGNITNLGAVVLDSPAGTEVNGYWGVAEFDGTDVSLVYVSSSGGSPYTNIQRTNVTSGTTTTLANFPAGLSDMAAFTVSIANNRWYFHHELASGTFGGTIETLGFADATFTVAAAPVAIPVPTMSFWGLAMLISLLGAFGFVRRRHPV